MRIWLALTAMPNRVLLRTYRVCRMRRSSGFPSWEKNQTHRPVRRRRRADMCPATVVLFLATFSRFVHDSAVDAREQRLPPSLSLSLLFAAFIGDVEEMGQREGCRERARLVITYIKLPGARIHMTRITRLLLQRVRVLRPAIVVVVQTRTAVHALSYADAQRGLGTKQASLFLPRVYIWLCRRSARYAQKNLKARKTRVVCVVC